MEPFYGTALNFISNLAQFYRISWIIIYHHLNFITTMPEYEAIFILHIITDINLHWFYPPRENLIVTCLGHFLHKNYLLMMS